MSVVTIVGAGMMGSAMSMPASDNGHEVRLVGTHLDREIVACVQAKGFHPTLKRRLPDRVRSFQIEGLNEALEGADLVIGGVSSFGASWFAETVLPLVDEDVPVLMVTKGLWEKENGELQAFPHYWQEVAGRPLSINAVGGPCISFELADRRNTVVCFCGDDPAVLPKLKGFLETDYYHICLSTDVIGVESAVALKNAYALGVSFAVGMQEAESGVGGAQLYNPQAALFAQAAREIRRLVAFLGGRPESVDLGIGDLYVTIYGGRTRRLGILLGRGLSFQEALAELSGVTLESVAIATRVASSIRKLKQRGTFSMKEFPLLQHIDEVINQGRLVSVPWESFVNMV